MVLQRTYTKIVDGTEIIVQEGSYSFLGADNLIHKVYYISDENGYQARSTGNEEIKCINGIHMYIFIYVFQ